MAASGIPMVSLPIRPPLPRGSDRKSGSVILENRTRQIIDPINKEKIFKPDIYISYDIIDGDQVILRLYEREEVVVRGSFSIQKGGADGDENTAHIGWISSKKAGNRLGSFLFLVMIKKV